MEPVPHAYEAAVTYVLEAHVVGTNGETVVFPYELVVPERPWGELQLVKGERWEPLKYNVVFTSVNSTDWGTCIVDWGDEGSGQFCWGGFGGVYTTTHSVSLPGAYTVTGQIASETYDPFVTMATVSFLPAPTGTLSIALGESLREISATVGYTDTVDYGVLLEWGDGSSVRFPGSNGEATEPHVYSEWGTYVLTLTLENNDWLPVVVTETITFERPPDPTGDFEVSVVDMATLAVEAMGDFEGARPDWGACLWWGDGPEEVVCFEGISGSFSEPHQYPSPGVYTPTLVVQGPDGTDPSTTTQVVDLTSEEPGPGPYRVYLPLMVRNYPPLPPGCTIENVFLTDYMVSTTVICQGLPEEWNFFFWGDELQTEAEPFGFYGNEQFTETHVYNEGVWTQAVKVLEGEDLVTISEQEVSIPGAGR